MSIILYAPNAFRIDIFIPAAESPTQAPLRVRKRIRNASETQAKLLASEIETSLRSTGAWAPVAHTPQAIAISAPLSSRTLGKALEIAWSDIEEGWSGQKDAQTSYNRARVAIELVGGANTPCARIKREQFVTLRAALEEKGLAPASVRAHQQSLSRVLYFAEREGWIGGRPRWIRPEVKNARQFTFSEAQDAKVLAYFEAIQQPTMADLYTLGVEAGFRLGELLSLEGQRVNLQTGLAHITGELSKNGEDRHVVLTRRAKGVLASRIERFGKGTLFPTWTRRMVSHYMRALRVHLEIETDECCFHATRHTCGSRMALRGVPLKIMMEQLGHKQPAVCLRYIHATATERSRVILEKMEKGVGE